MTMPPFDGRRFAALLFDMDGTLLLSTESAERVWSVWARRHDLDAATILPTIHGVRTIDTIRALALPGVDAEAEARWIMQAEIDDARLVRAVPGAARFFASLPPERWTIATSAPRPLAEARLLAAGVSPPPTLVTAEDVAHGKPDPECYRLAADRLGTIAQSCLVFEDAAAGIGAAEAAGAAVVVVTAGHTSPIDTAHATIADFEGLEAISTAQGLALRRRG